MLADGGDALCDLGEALLGSVASRRRRSGRSSGSPPISARWSGIAAARAEAGARAWRRGARPRPIEIGVDATLLIAALRQGRRGGPLHGRLGLSADARLPRRRRGGAGRSAAAGRGGRQHGRRPVRRARAAARARRGARGDPGPGRQRRATRELLDFCREGNPRFSIGLDLSEPIRTAILAPVEDAWVPAICRDGVPRADGAWVAEIADGLDLAGWPAGSRVIVRREIPHPGAQPSLTDHDGHRVQAILTDQPDTDIAYPEARHRGHARVEDRIRTGKDTGMDRLPFRA
jgi:hypothetical protein